MYFSETAASEKYSMSFCDRDSACLKCVETIYFEVLHDEQSLEFSKQDGFGAELRERFSNCTFRSSGSWDCNLGRVQIIKEEVGVRATLKKEVRSNQKAQEICVTELM
jgi:hypothetical protein